MGGRDVYDAVTESLRARGVSESDIQRRDAFFNALPSGDRAALKAIEAMRDGSLREELSAFIGSSDVVETA